MRRQCLRVCVCAGVSQIFHKGSRVQSRDIDLIEQKDYNNIISH